MTCASWRERTGSLRCGPLQMSLFDVHDFAEISHPGCPGERLICCCNPFLFRSRASRRQALLTATEADLDKIAASAAAGRLKDPDKTGIRVGKVIGKHKMARHFITQITGTSLAYRRDAEQIAAEAAIDGIYVIRTSVTAATLDAAGTITACKNLKYAGRDLAVIKTGDPGLRPIYHYLDKRVRAHVLIAMLAAYLTWHLRAALAELTCTDQHIPEPASPVAPARRSPRAKAKDAARRSEARLPSASTATCSATCPHSTGRPSPSAASTSPNSPSPPPSSAGSSKCPAAPSPSP